MGHTQSLAERKERLVKDFDQCRNYIFTLGLAEPQSRPFWHPFRRARKLLCYPAKANDCHGEGSTSNRGPEGSKLNILCQAVKGRQHAARAEVRVRLVNSSRHRGPVWIYASGIAQARPQRHRAPLG